MTIHKDEPLPLVKGTNDNGVRFPSAQHSLRTQLSVYLSGGLKSLSLRVAALSWIKDIQGLRNLDSLLARGDRCIVVFWHGKYVPLVPLLRGRSACVFTSCSHRGSLIADICRRFGFTPVQIPDEKHDSKLRFMSEALRRNRAGAIAVDGPRGPYHLVKRGAVELASALAYTIVPVSVASSRVHMLSQRWDLMEVPKLFSRVCMVVGEPINVPAAMSHEQVLQWSSVLHDTLENIDGVAAERVHRLAV